MVKLQSRAFFTKTGNKNNNSQFAPADTKGRIMTVERNGGRIVVRRVVKTLKLRGVSKISSSPNFHFQAVAAKTMLDHKKLPEVSFPFLSLIVSATRGENCFTTLVNLTTLVNFPTPGTNTELDLFISSGTWSFLIHVMSCYKLRSHLKIFLDKMVMIT